MHAYGLNLDLASDIPGSEDADPAPAWPRVAVLRREGPAPSVLGIRVGDDAAELHAPAICSLHLSREPLTLTVTSPSPVSDTDLVHPFSAFVGSVVARWSRRTALHGATVVVDGRAWIVLGSPGSGKSTLAVALSTRDVEVMADDLSVITDGHVLAGPAVSDLRPEASSHLDLGVRSSEVGRARFRVELPPAPRTRPVGGFLELGWGSRVATSRLRPADALRVLGENEALSLGPSYPTAFLELLQYPFFTLERPQSWAALDATIDLLLTCARQA